MDPKKPASNPVARPAGGNPPARPAVKAAPKKPGDGLLGWFGRQVGHVKNAVKADVTKPGGGPKSSAGGRSAQPQAKAVPPNPGPAKQPPPRQAGSQGGGGGAGHQPSPGPSSTETVIYREDKVELAEMPDRPGVLLRRTIIDEVVVGAETKATPPAKTTE